MANPKRKPVCGGLFSEIIFYLIDGLTYIWGNAFLNLKVTSPERWGPLCLRHKSEKKKKRGQIKSHKKTASVYTLSM